MNAGRLASIGGWLRRRAENVAVALLATVFVAFLLQVVFRYLLNLPLGWTLEVSTLAWMWLVLWGAAFIVRPADDISFDILCNVASPRMRRVFDIVSGTALVLLLLVTLPAVVDYVTFMKIERASYIGVRLDVLFSVYVIFVAALVVRFSIRVWRAASGTTHVPAVEASGQTD
ncbi:MAG: TRAP transporter small permease subunit [Pseudomonadota bacterium]|nr:TRAP transporter small permease subunit [Pseudomonadota bacterium]